MARIRSTKPEFWDDRKLARSTSRDARMLYMALWNQADEWSRLNGDELWIKGRAFPYDDDLTPHRISALLDELDYAGRIQRYESEGDPYIFLPKLANHQRLEPKVESRLPAPPPRVHADTSESHADTSESHADTSSLLYVAGSMEHGAGANGYAAPHAHADESETPKEPPSTCSKHPNGTEERCGACGTARRRHSTWLKTEADRTAATKVAAAATRLACPECDEDGWLLDDDGLPTAARCDHLATRPIGDMS